MIKKEIRIKNPKLAEQYHRFWTEWAGQDIEPQMAKMDLNTIRFSTSTSLPPSLTIPGPARSNSGRTSARLLCLAGGFSPSEDPRFRLHQRHVPRVAAESIKEKPSALAASIARRCSARLEWKTPGIPAAGMPARGGSRPLRGGHRSQRRPDVSRPCAGKGGSVAGRQES